jgi:serine/threonine protein kinase
MTKQHIYFVMDFVRGGELSCRIKSIKRLDEETAKFYAYQVIVAIKYLHKKKIIYRDLKPENVLIGEDGYLKLADFGLAKYLAEGDSTKTM